MKIKMLMRIAGSRNGVRWPEAGTVVDLPEGEANDLVSQGIAEVVKAEKREAAKAETRPAKRAETRKHG